MSDPAWTLEFYEEGGREPVLDFLRGLDELKEQSLTAALRNVLAYEGVGVRLFVGQVGAGCCRHLRVPGAP
jgi:hypothetical protein